MEVTEEPVAEALPAAPEAEGDLMTGDDALAWLESLTIGKEDELRAQAELDSEARIAEILGRRPTPVQEEAVEEPVVETISEPEPETEATIFEVREVETTEPEFTMETSIISEPALELEVMEIEEPVTEAAKPELTPEVPVNSEPALEPETVEIEEPVTETAEPELTLETPVISEPTPEPEAVKIDEPVAEVAEEVAATAPVAELDALEEMREHLKRKRSDHNMRLTFSRTLCAAGDIKEAMKNYSVLIKSGAKMEEIYQDLQAYLEIHPKDSDVLRTLGDAYMKDGVLERALEIYNEAMSIL
ncbi:MAG: hypothetical protein E4H27_05815 [Anaerolineales bacterium]|nr:MAG: hypothetical protein E4H27_05815 [Anaerolineales bacterium]